MAKFKPQSFRARFPQQYLALLRKNALVAWRNKYSTALRILAPCIFIILVLLLDFAVRADANNSEQFKELRNPGRTAIGGIPECESDVFIQAPCYDFIYSPNTSAVAQGIVSQIRNRNEGRPITEDRVRGFETLDAANAWLLAEPEKAGVGVHFELTDATTIDFHLQLNASVKYFRGKGQNPVDFFGMPMQVAAQREISRYLAETVAGEQLQKFDIGWKIFPHPVNQEESLIGTFMSLFLFVASMFSFVMTMTAVIGERESKVTQALQTMGMMRSAYWASWINWDIFLSLVTTLIAIAFGAAVQIDFFLKNSFGNVFFTLFLFQLAMTGFAYFMSAFIRKVSSAISLGFVVFLMGFVFWLVVNFDVPYSEEHYDRWGYILTILFSALPWCPFAKAVTDLGDATINTSSKGLAWNERGSYCEWDDGCRMGLPLVWAVLAIEFVGYAIVAIYLNAVLPDSSGVRDPPHYFLMPSFWRPRLYRAHDIKQDQKQAPEPANLDDDVAEERARMQARLARGETGLEGDGAGAGPTGTNGALAIDVWGLQRRFAPLQGGKEPFWAVTNSWLEIANNQLFCLLGPNGAGKSTTINMLNGVLPPSGGDAVMIGESIRTPGGMQEIRTNMGVCPQFDILWGELTAREHMLLFGNVKGLATKEDVIHEADSLLKEVNLTYAANQRAGSFSGGMKRRLSVAVALLGDPKLVFLDEPTTGMDPVSRRQVWDIIERAKQDRAVVLTTHSMEEADILGDRIAIMARGSLRCLGTSLRLKQKFGAGYQVAISVASAEDENTSASAQRAEDVKQFIRDTYGFEPLSESSAYITYLIARSDEQRLPTMLKNLEDNTQALKISDIQISLTTLEEVFLSIAKQAELENAAGKNIKTEVELGDGHRIQVDVGAETALDPTTNTAYSLVWGQDHNGQLCVTEVIVLPPQQAQQAQMPAAQ